MNNVNNFIQWTKIIWQGSFFFENEKQTLPILTFKVLLLQYFIFL